MAEQNDPRNPLTEDQLAFLSEQTRRAAKHATRRYAQGAILGFLILLFGIGYNFVDYREASNDSRAAIVQSGKTVAVDGCNRDFNSISALRGLLTSAQAAQAEAVKRGDIPKPTPERQKLADDFYADQLKKIELPDCREAEKVLTDDPDIAPEIPEPRYPKPVKPKGNG